MDFMMNGRCSEIQNHYEPEVIFRTVRSLLRPEFRLCWWIMQIGVVNLLPNELGYDMIET